MEQRAVLTLQELVSGRSHREWSLFDTLTHEQLSIIFLITMEFQPSTQLRKTVTINVVDVTTKRMWIVMATSGKSSQKIELYSMNIENISKIFTLKRYEYVFILLRIKIIKMNIFDMVIFTSSPIACQYTMLMFMIG